MVQPLNGIVDLPRTGVLLIACRSYFLDQLGRAVNIGQYLVREFSGLLSNLHIVRREFFDFGGGNFAPLDQFAHFGRHN